MQLTLGNYPVNQVISGTCNRWENGTLTVNEEYLAELITEDPRVDHVTIEIASPGESARIWPVRDVIEPRIKISGGSIIYPGICGRPVKGVGNGRTNRLSGICVVEVSEVPWHEAGHDNLQTYIDMSGPWGEKIPYSSLFNICVVVEPIDNLGINEKNRVVHEACLKVSDALASTTRSEEADSVDTFSIEERESTLPNVVYIQCIHSSQATSGNLQIPGASDTFCTSIYGHTELSPPVALHPNELLDGAISGPYRTAFATSWMLVNNPILQDLYALHGKELNFVGCIAMRTEWTTQREKDLIAEQTARLAKLLGADGSIITWDAGGNEEVEVVQVIRECNRLDIQTVWLTSDDDLPSNGVPTLLTPVPDLDAIVSTGCFRGSDIGIPEVPSVERVIGSKTKQIGRLRDTVVDTSGPLPPPAMYDDHYGLMSQTGREY